MPRFLYALSGALFLASFTSATPLVRVDNATGVDGSQVASPVTVAVATSATAAISLSTEKPSLTTVGPVPETNATSAADQPVASIEPDSEAQEEPEAEVSQEPSPSVDAEVESSLEPEAETSVEPDAEVSSEPLPDLDSEAESSLEPEAETSVEPQSEQPEASSEIEFFGTAGPPIPASGCGECGDGLICTPTPWNGQGTSECFPKPPTCYGPGERNVGATNKTYVPYARCCDGQESVPRPGDYGRFCPETTAASPMMESPVDSAPETTSAPAIDDASSTPETEDPTEASAVPLDLEPEATGIDDSEVESTPEATAFEEPEPEATEAPDSEPEITAEPF